MRQAYDYWQDQPVNPRSRRRHGGKVYTDGVARAGLSRVFSRVRRTRLVSTRSIKPATVSDLPLYATLKAGGPVARQASRQGGPRRGLQCPSIPRRPVGSRSPRRLRRTASGSRGVLSCRVSVADVRATRDRDSPRANVGSRPLDEAGPSVRRLCCHCQDWPLRASRVGAFGLGLVAPTGFPSNSSAAWEGGGQVEPRVNATPLGNRTAFRLLQLLTAAPSAARDCANSQRLAVALSLDPPLFFSSLGHCCVRPRGLLASVKFLGSVGRRTRTLGTTRERYAPR